MKFAFLKLNFLLKKIFKTITAIKNEFMYWNPPKLNNPENYDITIIELMYKKNST